MNRRLRFMAVVNFTVISILGIWVFVAPAAILVWELRDPGLSDGTIPRLAFRRHASLAPHFGRWARERVKSGKASRLGADDVAATEWPMFSSVFFLWATEALQESWSASPSVASVEPRRQAAEAIEAAVDLVADPIHAAWVRQHWGANYLQRENLFYRMLLISGLASYQKLTGQTRYESLLAEQVESLAKEIDSSPHGLLDDYPGECYPIDVLPAIAAIHRAGALLGKDRSAFVSRSIRAFQGRAVDADTGLPAYEVDSKTGQGVGPARGIGISYMLIWAPELWPGTAEQWYASFERYFWHEGMLLKGFREFPQGLASPDWSIDVDAGPVIWGYGTAASAFGIGSARANGRLDQAYALGAQAMAASWPLPDGSLLIPRALSNVAHSPFLGESALLFCLTRRPSAGSKLIPASTRMPWFAGLMIAIYLGTGLLIIAAAVRSLGRWQRGGSRWNVPLLRAQSAVWAILILAGGISLVIGRALPGFLLLLSAQLFPRFASIPKAPSPGLG